MTLKSMVGYLIGDDEKIYCVCVDLETGIVERAELKGQINCQRAYHSLVTLGALVSAKGQGLIA